jgi:hypothetical protein
VPSDTASVRTAIAEFDAASVTLAVKEYSPDWVLVPPRAPVVAWSLIPGARDPPEIVHWYGGVPPLAERFSW